MANTGKDFEAQIKKAIDNTPNTYYYRLRDSATSFNPSSTGGVRFTPSNDYDAFMYQFPYLYPLELKSNKGTAFSFPKLKTEKGKDIKMNQIEGLTKSSHTHGVYAGFLFNFSTKARTYWLNIVDFLRFYDSTEKKSINENDIIEYGGILIEQTIKKTTYSFNIQKLMDDIKTK